MHYLIYHQETKCTKSTISIPNANRTSFVTYDIVGLQEFSYGYGWGKISTSIPDAGDNETICGF